MNDEPLEDRLILQPDGSRACYNWECKDWTIIDPNTYCPHKDYCMEECDGYYEDCPYRQDFKYLK